MTNWLEVSLTVDGELAEAVADVLARFAPNGVVTEQGIKFMDDEDHGTPAGSISVRAYLEMDEHIEETRQKLEEALYYLGMIQPVPTPVYKQIADQNWMEAWKYHYQPIPIGRRLIIVPVWLDSPEPERIPIKIDPGMAFGTGTHPTTQLSLEMIERTCHSERSEESLNREGDSSFTSLTQNDKNLKMIDIGCGSGILSIAAIKLGAQTALGVDIDIESIRNARENADKNGIGGEFIIGQGSVTDVLEGKYPFKSAPLVVANILAPIIIRLFDDGLADLAESDGRVILSGILDEQEGKVLETAQAKGLVLSERKQMGDWVALCLSKNLCKNNFRFLNERAEKRVES
ncbi:MAG: 50S ribosomal protein L11 methyltransferase [Anaerolineales bacterium]|jgi:ribosomal protein L11 methyltransferase